MGVMPTPKMKRRLNIFVTAAMSAFTLAIVFQMSNTAITESENYQAMANRNQFGSITIHANRGSIFDKNGKILAQSATVYDIVLDPSRLLENCTYTPDGATEEVVDENKRQKAIELIAGMLDLNVKDVEKKALKTEGSGNKWQMLKAKVEKPLKDELLQKASEMKITALTAHENTKRYYPQGELAASVIGFVGQDGGQYGLEAKYDDYLAGVDGRIISAKDAFQNEIPYRYEKMFPAQEGNSLELTLDMTLQHYLEKYLKEAVDTYQANQRACGIMMNAKTGAILAMATVPGFDLNEPAVILDPKISAVLDAMPQSTDDEKNAYQIAYANARERQWKNKTITELYYPGSVFKVITAASALEDKVINTKEQSWVCHPIPVAGTNKYFNCWKNNAHGIQDLFWATTNSCNPAFIQIGDRLGADAFSDYYAAFGFTEGTGIDLPGEMKTSLYYTREKMGKVELQSSSFGQTNKVTPIQMITAYAAVVNGGNLVTPYMVSKVKDAEGNVVESMSPNIRRQVISEETSAQMREILEFVVSNKGGSNAYIKGYSIGGKSGTSQKQDENRAQNREDLYVSSYVGFAPADNPEIICLVMVDEPTTGEYYGSVIAVPVVKQVFEEALPYLGYYPEYTAEELEQLDIAVPPVEGLSVEQATAKLTELGLTAKVMGSGDTVIGQMPLRGSAIAKDGRVLMYTDPDYVEETVTMPNLVTGTVNLDAANQLLAQYHLNLKASGASSRKDAVAISQGVEAGTVIPKGTIVEVTFAVKDQG